jgi:replicative DNA helicase
MTSMQEQETAKLERSLCGSVLANVEVMPAADQLVSADDFLFCRVLWQAIRAEWGENPKSARIELAGVYSRLRQNPSSVLIDLGGVDGLRRLLEIDPVGMDGVRTAMLIREQSHRRRLVWQLQFSLSELQGQSGDKGVRPLDEVLAELRRAVESGAGTKRREQCHSMAEVILEIQREIDSAAKLPAGATSAKFGIEMLDAVTGGMHGGELCLLAARPSVGKTALAISTCRHVAELGGNVLLFSLEQSRYEIGSRLLAALPNVMGSELRSRRIAEVRHSAFMDACERISPLPLWVNDCGSLRVRTISSIARRLHASKPLSLIAIDYLQLITADDPRSTRNEQVSDISRTLKLMARDLGVPVLCLSQLSREVEKRNDGLPRLSDLRDSGSLEQDADTVIFLHRLGRRDASSTTEILKTTIAKQRNGPTAECQMVFTPKTMTFEAPEQIPL